MPVRIEARIACDQPGCYASLTVPSHVLHNESDPDIVIPAAKDFATTRGWTFTDSFAACSSHTKSPSQ